MKLNLFNGIINFEGSIEELRQVMDDMDNMTKKLVDLQLITNDALVVHQTALAKLAKEYGEPKNGRMPPGLAQ